MAIFSTILTALNLAKEVKDSGVGGRIASAKKNISDNNFSSIASKASEGILQFPVIITDSVDYNTAVMVTKALERSYAAFIQTIISMNSNLGDMRTDNISGYLGKLHDNSLSGVIDSDGSGDEATISGFQTALGIKKESSVKFDIDDPENTNVTFTCEVFVPDKAIMTNTLKEELKFYLEGFCLDKLNDKHKPVSLENASYMVPMFEAKGGRNKNKNKKDMAYQKLENENKELAKQNAELTAKLASEYTRDAKDVNLLSSDVKKANELQPTFIKVNIRRSDKEARTMDEYNFIIGIKATLHMAKSTEYITNLVSACEYKGNLFRFIKWSSGEISFLKDFVLRMDEFSKETTGRVTNKSHWWEALKRRAREAKISKVKTNRLLPNATFVFTTEEVEYIKANFGYDLLNISVAKRLMQEYFLLGYVVLDVANELASILYDGQKNFQLMTFKNMERENASAERQFKEILRATRRM